MICETEVLLTRTDDTITVTVPSLRFSATITLDGATRPWADEVFYETGFQNGWMTARPAMVRDGVVRIEAPSGDTLCVSNRA